MLFEPLHGLGIQMVRRFVEQEDVWLLDHQAAEGHPASVMDMSFANQALSAEYAIRHADTLENRVYVVPTEIDEAIARLKLAAMGITIDELSDEQRRYLGSWTEGT